MKRFRFALLTLIAVLGLSLAGMGARGPIVILGNSDFTAENGIVAGSGTAEDPYIIA